MNPILTVREAYRVDQFKMASWLGITVSELSACERDGTWPRSENARRKLIEIAATEGLTIAPPAPEAEPSLF